MDKCQFCGRPADQCAMIIRSEIGSAICDLCVWTCLRRVTAYEIKQAVAEALDNHVLKKL